MSKINADKKGTITVDKAFLISLDNWRTLLAETVSKENKQLDEDELNFVVQQTLDRIIFLRICEDRGIETYGSLEDCLKVGNYYENILQEFKDADDKYNSGLFDFKKDKISQKVLINNATVKTIIEQLYSPLSPYAFAVLSVEILGSAYEQFLGKTITINSKGKAIIELKPEVRKSGGVYYTPQYIVDYIVANTIGNLIKNKTPKEVEEITIVDPACGSGSFLLGAYQYLLTWHKDYYLKNPKKNTITPDGNLTTGEKKKILLNNIFGVDIDFNAVEVTKLSLLLKCMEGETYASIENQKTMFNERVLPTLEGNIKSGNSLIDTDYYENQLEFGEERKVKPFSWKKNFPTVFKSGGFDVVIGNPPYVSIRNLTETQPQNVKNYFSVKYKTAFKGYDLYVLFFELGLNILRKSGLLAFITPNKFATLDYGLALRKNILRDNTLQAIIDVSQLNVFDNVSVYPYISIIQKSTTINNIVKIKICEAVNDLKLSNYEEVRQNDYLANPNFNISLNVNRQIVSKLNDVRFLKDICKVQAGTTGFLATKTKECITDGGEGLDFVVTGSIDRYDLKLGNVRYINKKFHLPKISNNANIISKGKWDLFQNKKIIIGGMTKVIEATIDEIGVAVGVGVYCLNKFSVNEYYLLGVLNSKYVTYFFRNEFEAKHLAGGFLAINSGQLEQIPIKEINFSNKQEKQSHDQIIVHVEQLLQLNKDLQTASLETKKEQIKSKIEYNEDKINALVYALYNLTDDEIKLIET